MTTQLDARSPRPDCPLCRLPATMIAGTVPRYLRGLRVVGVLIAAPSALGALLAAGGLVALVGGTPAGGGTAALPLVAIAAACVVAGTVGWYLLSSRAVLRCAACGYTVDRS